jgi:hypothetical protein
VTPAGTLQLQVVAVVKVTVVNPPELIGALLQSPKGVEELDAADGAEFPLMFIATTVKVYAVPPVNPVKVQEVLTVFTQAGGADTEGEDVTV